MEMGLLGRRINHRGRKWRIRRRNIKGFWSGSLLMSGGYK